MSDQPTIVVIGAGIVGASVAYRLAEGGAAVTVIDQGEPGHGTSASSFAWVNANRKTPRPYFDLNHAGMTEHRRLADDLGPADWFHPDGNLIWPAPAERDELRERVERLNAWGYDAAWLDARTVVAELEPDIAFTDPDEPVAWFAQEAWVDAPALVRRLLTAARERGAEIRTNTAAREIETAGGKVSGVLLSNGERLAVDAVVNAAGPAAADVAALVGLPLPLVNKPGFLVQVGAGGQPVRRVLHLPGLNLRPDGHHRLLLQDADLDDQLAGRSTLSATDPLVTGLIERTRALVPTIGHAPVTAVRIGVRPIPRDGLSCVGADAGLGGYYDAVTHSGVTLGPLLGRLLAREILSGEVDPLLVPFRPERLRTPVS